MYKKAWARAELMFCSLNLLLFDVPVAVAVVVSKGPLWLEGTANIQAVISFYDAFQLNKKINEQ